VPPPFGGGRGGGGGWGFLASGVLFWAGGGGGVFFFFFFFLGGGGGAGKFPVAHALFGGGIPVTALPDVFRSGFSFATTRWRVGLQIVKRL